MEKTRMFIKFVIWCGFWVYYFPIFTLFSSNRIKTIKMKNQHKSQQPKKRTQIVIWK